jgi:hypothetical protein
MVAELVPLLIALLALLALDLGTIPTRRRPRGQRVGQNRQHRTPWPR